MQKRIQVDYGYDAPGIIRTLLGVGVVGIVAAACASYFLEGVWAVVLTGLLGIAGFIFFGLGCSMTAYAVWGKYRLRVALLDLVRWQGSEQVLDIGTGRGLMALGAATRLTTGSVIGIDIWRTEDLSDNLPEAPLQNARALGLEDKVQFLTEDARQLSFADNSFDVIYSVLCIHNIDEVAERRKACAEIVRVLKPGGVAIIADYIAVASYAKAFREEGLQVEPPQSYRRTALGLMDVVVARKQA